MPVIPNIPQPTELKVCDCCHTAKPINHFIFTYNEFYPDHHAPICNGCLAEKIEAHDRDWAYLDKICMWLGIPWIVKEWVRIDGMTSNIAETLKTYSSVFQEADYETIGWSDYYRQYKKLREVGLIEEEIPEVREQRYKDLRLKWGENYDDSELNRLEDLYSSILKSYNVVSGLQEDQAQKLCKVSLEVDSRIRAGDKDVDKFMATYDKLVKGAEFTPKNTKNASDFDSVAEIAYWLEKHGRINQFYDDVTRDVIDETLKNIENFNQRLYVNEGGIGEEIKARLNSLNLANKLETDTLYDLQQDFDQDEYANEAYIIDEGETEEFNPSGGLNI